MDELAAWDLADGASTPVVLRNGATFVGVATRRGDWIDVTAPVDATGLDPWALLALNGALVGGARFVLSDDRARIRTESRVGSAAESVRTDLKEAHHTTRCPGILSRRVPPPDGEAWQQWTTQLDGSGWRSSARDGDRVMVDLAMGDGFAQARVRPWGTGLYMETGLGQVDDELSRQAIGRLLLTATDSGRLVRAARTDDEVHLETLTAPGIAENLDQALAALQVITRMVGREVDALRDPSLARRYLELTLSKERQCDWMERAFSCSM